MDAAEAVVQNLQAGCFENEILVQLPDEVVDAVHDLEGVLQRVKGLLGRFGANARELKRVRNGE